MRAKLSDVAKKAGVSPTTVSRVINNYGYISDKTRNKVHEAMKELNYQPNSLARSLHGKKTNLVGLIFCERNTSLTTIYCKESIISSREINFNSLG